MITEKKKKAIFKLSKLLFQYLFILYLLIFVIGKIKEVTSSDNEVFNTASIELLAEPQDFDSVFVITNLQ